MTDFELILSGLISPTMTMKRVRERRLINGSNALEYDVLENEKHILEIDLVGNSVWILWFLNGNRSGAFSLKGVEWIEKIEEIVQNYSKSPSSKSAPS